MPSIFEHFTFGFEYAVFTAALLVVVVNDDDFEGCAGSLHLGGRGLEIFEKSVCSRVAQLFFENMGKLYSATFRKMVGISEIGC